jgi:putative endopeptidase
MSTITHRSRIVGTLVVLAALSACATAPKDGLDKSAFDPAVRVQDDLFRAVNGRWLATAEIAPDKTYNGTWLVLRDRADARVRALLDSLGTQAQAPGSNAQKIHAHYTAFLDTDAIDKAGLAPVSPLLAEVDGITSTKALATWQGRMLGVIGMPVMVGVSADPKEPTINRVFARQGGLGLPDRDYYLKKDDASFAKARVAYEQYLTLLATQAGVEQPAEAVRRVMALEERIAQAHWDVVSNRDPLKTYNPMSLAALATMAPGFDWLALFEAAQLGQLDRLSVSQPSAVTAMAKLYVDMPLSDWKLYFKLQVLKSAAAVLPKAIRDGQFAYQSALGGAKEQAPRWQQGVQHVNDVLGEAVGQLYVAQHFPGAHKERMLDMVQNLKAAYQQSIESLTWMSPTTKREAQAKLAKYGTKIGYPDRWRDYSALEVRAGDAFGNHLRARLFDVQRNLAKAGKPYDRSEWFTTPQTVNAFYSSLANDITFPAAVLEAPFFDMSADDAANYGAIGSIIGHELSHGFDIRGSRYDGDGALRNWWTDEDRKAFDALGAKVVAQYGQYEPLPGKRLSGELTLAENMADLSGSQIAYKAYVRSLNGKPAPVIDGYDGKQRFFLGYAQAWRYKSRDEGTQQRLVTGVHSPAEFRVNGVVVNHDGFHEAFGTEAGDALHKPEEERIRIW